MLVFPGVQGLDVTGPLDVFAEANRFLGPDDQYTLHVLGTAPGPVRCANGMTIQPDTGYDAFAGTLDLLMVAGGPRLPRMPRDAALSTWLQARHGTTARIASICNGAFLLAHAGLLDGRQATTHWNDASTLSARFPAIRVAPDRLFVKDERVYTSAGVTAGIDLALFLLYEDHGPALSLNVAKRLVVFTQRSGGQSQFSPYLTPFAGPAAPQHAVQQHVLAHLAGDLSLRRLADVAAMSARNFGRVFLRDVGITPAAFVERARIDAARVLLEADDAPLKTVAYRCGFGSPAHMRAAFVKHLGVTAAQYRAHFGAIGGPAAVSE